MNDEGGDGLAVCDEVRSKTVKAQKEKRPALSTSSVSIIIPTLNEADLIGESLEKARAIGDCEILVVDGGSDDGTAERATAAGLVRTSMPGRAVQQNAGAAAATGEVLLFLHADCRLEAGALEAVIDALLDPRVVAGCFRQRIDAPGLRYRLLERGNALRVKLCKWAYGDQGIFVRREAFERVGGFPELQLMEDLFLMKRLKTLGRVVLLDTPLHVSARRWQQQGVARQTLRNWALTLLAQCGVSPNRLARFYPHVR
ncbi:MAG: TIGR04283 family arsenosugar biosynthesis glycosyltransferase [Planctomycetaceae bacterium]